MANSFKKLQVQVLSDPVRRARVDEIMRAMYTGHRLGAHREARQTRRQVGAKLNVTQANVTHIEHESSLYLSTLRNYVEALGGRLEITAVFDDEHVTLVDEHGSAT